MMVAELIELLSRCDPEQTVMLAYPAEDGRMEALEVEVVDEAAVRISKFPGVWELVADETEAETFPVMLSS